WSQVVAPPSGGSAQGGLPGADRLPVIVAFSIEEGDAPDTGAKALLDRFDCSGSASLHPPLEKEHVVAPPAAVLRQAAGAGANNVYPDLDGVLRSVPLVLTCGQSEDKLYPSLSLEALRVAEKQPPGSCRPGGDAVEVGSRRLALSGGSEMWLNFAGGYRTFPWRSFHELLSPMDRAAPNAWQGAFVIIASSRGAAGSLTTPVAARLPGAEVQATALSNLLRGDYLRPSPPWLLMTLLALCCLLTGALVVDRPVLVGGRITALLAAICAVGAYLFFLRGYHLSAAGPILGVLATGVALLVREAGVADRSKAQAEARLVSRLQAIAGIGRLIDTSLDREQLLLAIMQWVETELDVEACSLLLLDEKRERLRFEVALGPKGDLAKDFTLAMGEGIVGIVAQSGESIIINEARHDPRRNQDIAKAIDYQLEKVVCVPMSLHGEVVGVLEVMNRRDNSDFTQHDCDLLQVIAQQASLFLENARLYGVLQERVEYANAGLLVAMKELRAEKARVETLVEEMVDGVVAVDAHGRIVLINSVARSMLGLHGGKLEGQEIIPLLMHPHLIELLQTPLTGREPSVSREVDLLEDGTRVVKVTAAHIEGMAGETAGKCVVFNDITYFKQLDQMKTDLVSFVSHELKTPLTSIGLYGYLLRERLQAQQLDQALDSAAAIDRQATRMKHMVEDFLNISRIEAGRPLEMLFQKVGQVYAFVEEVVMIEARTTKDHDIRLDLPEDLPALWADRGKLEEVLINLVNNAIKYSPDGGAVTVSAAVTGTMMQFSVRDSGLGIAQDEQSRLFQRFQRVGRDNDQRISGTGLGLFVCKALIEAHGGRIWVDSVLGQGSTFHFTVPLYVVQDKEQPTDAGADNA
ncbi:MAG: ATP-binding protein, partial [Armatimonadota bacterium]